MGNHAALFGPPADGERPAAQEGRLLLDGAEERVEVEVKDLRVMGPMIAEGAAALWGMGRQAIVGAGRDA